MSTRLPIPDVDTEADFDRRMKIEEGIGLPNRAVWSIFEVIDMLDDVAIEGNDIIMTYKDHWGPQTVQERCVINPTWRDLALMAAKLIGYSTDQHHIFIEAFNVTRSGDNIELDLLTGS
jgi:hypothetical protein